MQADGRKEWTKRNATNLLRVAIVVLFLLLAVWAITLNRYELVIANREPWLWLTVALVNVGPELAGIVIGVVTIDYLNERRQREQLKAQLIRQMGSPHNDVADPAVRELAHHKWLYNGSLHGAKLAGANLRAGELSGADLSGANLRGADLSGANLRGADLSGAYLNLTNLSEAVLFIANLSRAILFRADLSGAYLGLTNLGEARQWTIEQLEQAESMEGAMMPDKVLLCRGSELKTRNTTVTFQSSVQGPTFEDWKAQYLARQEAKGIQNEADSELDHTTTNGQTESGLPDPI